MGVNKSVYEPFLSTTRSTPVKCIRVVVLFVSVGILVGDVVTVDCDDRNALVVPAFGSPVNGACTNKRAFEHPIVRVYLFVLFNKNMFL